MALEPEFTGQFMPTMIPAAPGTNIIEATTERGVFFRTPVVAWAPDAENPYRAPHPITINGLERLVDSRAVEFVQGDRVLIHDRRSVIPFSGTEEWMNFVEHGTKASVREQHTVSTKSKKAEKAEGHQLLIEWTTSPFKNNSFYRYTDEKLDFIFQVEGGLNPPKQRGAVQKIKRDEFVAMKKTMDVAEYADLVEGRAPGLDELGDFSDDLVGKYADEDGLI